MTKMKDSPTKTGSVELAEEELRGIDLASIGAGYTKLGDIEGMAIKGDKPKTGGTSNFVAGSFSFGDG